MKKLIIILLSIILLSYLSAENYKIKDYEFNISGAGLKIFGTTKEYSIITKYPINTNTIYSSIEDLENFLTDYKTQLESSRAFEDIEIKYETLLSEEPSDITEIILKFDIQDSHHFLAIPMFNYNSNNGLTLKLKVKDTNFLGSLNTMNFDLNVVFNDGKVIPGLNFSYDQPFKAGIFDATWVNNYTISYTIGKSIPEWNLKTGLKFILPKDKISFMLEFYQYSFKNYEYECYEDDLYFNEEFIFSTPISLYTFENFSNLIYTPYLQFDFNWDFNHIDKQNDDLSSPTIILGHSIQNAKISWIDNFRHGYDLKFTNKYAYNIQRQDFSPSISFEGYYFNSFKLFNSNFLDTLGINTHLLAFTYIDLPFNTYFYGDEIGKYLRGILDTEYFGNEKPKSTSSSAIVLNIDLPYHIFRTNFKHDIINFDLQLSPFFDMALIYDRNTNRVFSFEDACYCTGLEVLVFPKKWNSYIIRASLGFDIKNAIKDEAGFFNGILNNKEIFIGIGTSY